MPDRIDKVNSLLASQISRLIARHVDFKRGVFVTVPKVETSRDLRHTNIHISVFPASEKNYVMKTLGYERYLLQKLLHKKLVMKNLPKIRFVYNDTEERADEVEALFKQIREEKKP